MLPLCHSDFVSYNVKVVKALLPYPPLPSLHIYLQSEGLSEWHTSHTCVINMTLRNKIQPLSPPYFLIRQPIHPYATLCTSHIWTPSLPSLPPLPFLSLTLQWHTYKYTTQLSRRRWWIHPSVLRIIIIKARACEV